MKAQCDKCGTFTSSLYRVKIAENNLGIKQFKKLCFKCVQKECGYSPFSGLTGKNKKSKNVTNSNI